jgi:hypothetical protein
MPASGSCRSSPMGSDDVTVSLYVAHYNFCRWHGSLKMTPAMTAKTTGHPWTIEELLTEAESE